MITVPPSNASFAAQLELETPRARQPPSQVVPQQRPLADAPRRQRDRNRDAQHRRWPPVAPRGLADTPHHVIDGLPPPHLRRLALEQLFAVAQRLRRERLGVARGAQHAVAADGAPGGEGQGGGRVCGAQRDAARHGGLQVQRVRQALQRGVQEVGVFARVERKQRRPLPQDQRCEYVDWRGRVVRQQEVEEPRDVCVALDVVCVEGQRRGEREEGVRRQKVLKQGLVGGVKDGGKEVQVGDCGGDGG